MFLRVFYPGLAMRILLTQETAGEARITPVGPAAWITPPIRPRLPEGESSIVSSIATRCFNRDRYPWSVFRLVGSYFFPRLPRIYAPGSGTASSGLRCSV